MKKFLYYLIQWTWGLPLNIIGLIALCIVLCINIIYAPIKKRSFCHLQKYRNSISIIIPWNFGGLELGMFFVRGAMNESVCAHEYGHSIQNLWWGPLFIIIIFIPSGLRYWYRKFYRTYIYPKTRKALPKYDSIWFEGQATNLGTKAEQNTWTWL